LKIEATGSSGTSADFQRTAGRYIPEDRPQVIYSYCYLTGDVTDSKHKITFCSGSMATVVYAQAHEGDAVPTPSGVFPQRILLFCISS
jgi:hypothetical protein